MKKTIVVMFLRRILFIATILCIYVSSSNAAFVHPGMFHTSEDLVLIKSRVLSGKEPWKSAFLQMKNSDYADLTIAPSPFEDVSCGPYNVPNIGGDEFYQDGNFAYTMALLWVITGDERYARKSIEILNAWSYTLKRVTREAKELKIGVAGVKYLNAAEIIKHTYTGWSEQDQNQFKSMILDIWYETIKNFKPTTNGNWDAAAEQTVMCIGIFLDRQDIFDRGYNQLTVGETNGAIDNYFSETGQCQESGRDQGHTQMGMSYICNACEIAWKQGYDAYSLYNNRLLKGFEYTSKFMLGEDVPYTRYITFHGAYSYGDTISQQGRGGFNPIYELPYHHYYGRKGLSMPYTFRVIKQTRYEEPKDGYIPWGTLIYADEEFASESVYVPNLDMSQWELLSGSSEYDALPKGYGVRGSSYKPYFSKSSETFEGKNAVKMTWSGTVGNGNYFLTPYVELKPGDYEIIFYVKGSGFIRTLNLCTVDVSEADRRARNPVGTTGIAYSSSPMGNTIKAQLFKDWTPIRVMVTVNQKADYSLIFSHNNIDGDPDNPLLLSGISINRLDAFDSQEESKLIPIRNIDMKEWNVVEGTPDYEPLPLGYSNGGNNATTRSSEYFSKSSETFNNKPVIKMTYGGSAGSCAYFTTPPFYLSPGEYELKFYVKGKGYFRSVNVSTVDSPEENRRTATPENLTSGIGRTFILRPMGNSSTAQTIADWTLKSQSFVVDTAGLYELNFGHNNQVTGNEFYVSGISLLNKTQPEKNADCSLNALLLYEPAYTPKRPEKLPSFDPDVANNTVDLSFNYSGKVPLVYPIGKDKVDIIVDQATGLSSPNNVCTIKMMSTDGSVSKLYTITFNQTKDFIFGCPTDFKSLKTNDFIVPVSAGVYCNEKLSNHGLYWGDNATRANSTGSFELITPPLVNGMGTVSFYVKDFVDKPSQDNNTSALVVRYRMNATNAWTRIDSLPATEITEDMGWIYKSYVLNKATSLDEGTPEVSFYIYREVAIDAPRDFVLDDFRITAYSGTSLDGYALKDDNLKVYSGKQSIFIEQQGNNFYQIYNLTGRLISSGHFTEKISVSVLHKGMYIVKVSKTAKKVIVN